MITVDVGTTLTRILGANHLAVNDWYQNAPEPPPPNFGGLRTNRANLLYLLDAIPDASWNDRRLGLRRRPADDPSRAARVPLHRRRFVARGALDDESAGRGRGAHAR